MAEETKPVNPETEEKQDENLVKCPCCGKLTLRKPLKINSIALDEYMASVVTGVPFAHTYKVYDSIDVTVYMPFRKEAAKLMKVVQTLNRISALMESDKEDEKELIKNAIVMLQIYSTIKSIVVKQNGTVKNTYEPCVAMSNFIEKIYEGNKEVDKIIAAYKEADTVENLSSLPAELLRQIGDVHVTLWNMLLEAGFTESFWKGIELA